ncbi:MAG TPA: hypothetical protein DIT77_00140 [Marinobacter hydrocarbonoclasticus]|nr:hypothetical protein [Marinobacter nauticus]|tara:strand:- start:9278 stop:12454 length:3177 start_codon:yes stop_codon:yes gene_type:complete
MAGGNDERVNLLISAAVDGLKNVEGLISDLQELEKSGRVELPDNSAALREGLGKTSEEMQALAGRLTELREQQGLVTQFAELKRETKELAEQQQAAKARATELGKALAQTEAPTRAQVQEFERAKKAAQGADEAWISNNRQLNELRGEMEAAGISTKDLAGEQVRIRKELDGVNTQAASLSSELTEMGQSAQQAAPATEDVAEAAEDLGEKADKSSGLLSKLGSGLKTVAAGATALVAGIGASAATLTVFSRGQASLADELTNTANAIGANREALQVWQIAGERVGLTGDKVADILRSVTERLGEFGATGGGEAAQVMEALNLKIEDFQNLRPEEQMLKFAAAIESLPKEQQVAMLEKLASDASQLQPLLENNAAGLKAIQAAAEEEGAIYTDEELDKLLKANDIYNDITLKIQGLTRRIGAELAPVVADATDKVVDLFDQNEMGEKLIDLFKRLTDWGADMAAKLVENADSISAGFGTLWNTIESGASGAMTLFRGLQTIVSGFVTLVSSSFAGILSIAEGVAFAMNKVGLVSDQTYNNISAKAGAARDTVVDLAKQTAEYGRKTVEAGKGVVGAFDDAAESGKKLQEETEKGIGTLTTLAENVETAVRKAGDETTKAGQKAKDLADSYEVLNVKSQQALNEAADKAQEAFEKIRASGTATKDKIEETFAAYAQSVIETGDKTRISALEAEAAQLGLRDALKEVKAQAEESGNAASSSAEDIATKAGNAADETKRLAEETKKAKQEAEEAREKFREALGAAFSKAISNAREQVTALSVAARNLFEMKIGGNAFVAESESAADALERARQRTDELASARRRLMSSSLAAWFADTALAAAEVEEKFWSQAVAMENLQGKIDSGSFSLDQLNRLSETAANRFDLLDKQRLSGLQSAIDSAKQKLQSLTDTADNTLNSLRQRLADIRGDTEEAQRIQYEAERKRLQEQLEQARQAGADEAAADYQQSLDTLEKIYQIEQKNRREAENAREKEAADRAREQQLAEIERQRAQRELSQPTTSQARTETVKTVNVNLGGQSFRVLADDQDALLRALENARSTAL